MEYKRDVAFCQIKGDLHKLYVFPASSVCRLLAKRCSNIPAKPCPSYKWLPYYFRILNFSFDSSMFDFLVQCRLSDLIQDIGVCEFESNALIEACIVGVSV